MTRIGHCEIDKYFCLKFFSTVLWRIFGSHVLMFLTVNLRKPRVIRLRIKFKSSSEPEKFEMSPILRPGDRMRCAEFLIEWKIKFILENKVFTFFAVISSSLSCNSLNKISSSKFSSPSSSRLVLRDLPFPQP